MPSRDTRAATLAVTGLMQDDYQLTLRHVLQRARSVYPGSAVGTMTGDGVVGARYCELAERADRLSAALSALGVQQGERVRTLAWNTQQHLELYLSPRRPLALSASAAYLPRRGEGIPGRQGQDYGRAGRGNSDTPCPRIQRRG